MSTKIEPMQPHEVSYALGTIYATVKANNREQALGMIDELAKLVIDRPWTVTVAEVQPANGSRPSPE